MMTSENIFKDLSREQGLKLWIRLREARSSEGMMVYSTSPSCYNIVNLYDALINCEGYTFYFVLLSVRVDPVPWPTSKELIEMGYKLEDLTADFILQDLTTNGTFVRGEIERQIGAFFKWTAK
jgi:hypothetical protein